MVEVQLVRRAADYASSSIPPPDGYLYGGRDNPSPMGMQLRRTTKIFLSLDGDELELEYVPVTVVFLPGVHEVENTVIRPYALSQLLVHPHPFGWPLPTLVILGGLVKPSVLWVKVPRGVRSG